MNKNFFNFNSKKQKNKIKISFFYYFLIFFIILLILFSIFNLKIFEIYGDSEKPFLENGDIVLIQKRKNYNVGDIITFKYNFSFDVTHRLIYIYNSENIVKYICFGDNNSFQYGERIDWYNYSYYIENLINEGYTLEQIEKLCSNIEIINFSQIQGVVVLKIKNGVKIFNFFKIIAIILIIINIFHDWRNECKFI